MDIIKFVVRSVMRGEVNLFSHRFSVSMQLIHGQPQVGATPETTTYEQTVITKYAPRHACRVCRVVSCLTRNATHTQHREDIAHLPHSLASKMKRRFRRHKHAEGEGEAMNVDDRHKDLDVVEAATASKSAQKR